MTGKVDIKVFGLDRLRAAFKRLGSSEITDEQLGEFAGEMPEVLRGTPYPPELPNQGYIRTFELKNSWDSEPIGPGRYDIINTARNPKTGFLYTSRVVGVRQATIHRGRWWKAVDIVRQKAIETFGKKVVGAVLKIWGR